MAYQMIILSTPCDLVFEITSPRLFDKRMQDRKAGEKNGLIPIIKMHCFLRATPSDSHMFI